MSHASEREGTFHSLTQVGAQALVSHQQWLAWFTVGNRLSNGAVLKYLEALDIAANSGRLRKCVRCFASSPWSFPLSHLTSAAAGAGEAAERTRFWA